MSFDKKNVIAALKRLKLDAWSILIEERQTCSLFLTKQQEVETSIDSLRVHATVTIYKRYGKKIGDARFILFSDDETELKEKVADSLLLTQFSKKPFFPLPKPQRYASVKLADSVVVAAFKERREEALITSLWTRILAAYKKEHEKERKKGRQILFNSAELDLTRVHLSVANSEGLSGESDATGLFVECFFTAVDGAGAKRREQESVAAVTVGRISDFEPEEFVRLHCSRARDILAAENFLRVQHGNVLLSGDALRDFWSPLLDVSPVVFHAAAAAKYKKLSRYKLGARITANKSFTVSSNPSLPFNPASSVFDQDGTASRVVSIIENGLFRHYFAPQRYAYYLKVPATGALGVIELSSGTDDEASLRTDETVEIVSFSSFSPNTMSGDFSAEIRLGYVYQNGKKTPIRAAMFSGNVFRMLETMRASKNRVTVERYSGPSLVRFDDGATVAGF